MPDTASATPFPLTVLWRHRDLLRQFTQRYIDVRHKGSLLGFVWAVLNPLMMLSLYTVVFGVVLGGHFGDHEQSPLAYALTMFLGLMLFHVVADTLGIAPGLIVSNPNFVKKVVFPLEILPAAAVGAAVFHFTISFALFLTGALLLGQTFTWTALWFPVVALPVVMLAMGLGWLLSALGVFFRDLQQGIAFLTMVLMYCSCVFFPPEKVPADVNSILRLNPLLHIIQQARQTVLWNELPSYSTLAYVYGASLFLFCFGFYVFCRTRPAFADVV